MNPLPVRRRLLAAAAAAALPAARARAADGAAFAGYPAVTPRALSFPRDHGAHPDYRIEWWYLTGLLVPRSAAGAGPEAAGAFGIQVTFFRVRPPLDEANPSRFAARQLLIAHAALADPARASLLKDEHVARAGFGLAQTAEDDTDVRLDRWRLRRDAASGRYLCELPARGFTLRFAAAPTQPLLLQGRAGYSQKGPRPAQASYYYSQPQLALDAQVEIDGRRIDARGRAWLDHEWSTAVLDPDAAGWDWIGMNLDDGCALTAFSIRRTGGGAPVYAYAALRAPGAAAAQVFGPQDVRFEPRAHWHSPRTRCDWPVAQRIRVGDRTFDTRPLFADQELDSRASTGAVYWEGASTLTEGGRRVGAGYLEMTGYAAPIVL